MTNTAFGFRRGVLVVVTRELLRLWRNKLRLFTGLTTPILWIGLFGSGMQGALRSASSGAFHYIDFIVPGVVAQTVLFAGIFASVSIITDREFGFIKELMIAPVPRTAIGLGKIIGAAIIASVQGIITYLASSVLGATINPFQALLMIPGIFLVALATASLGFLVASRIRSQEAFQAIVPALILPLFFLSGALFPMKTAPLFVQALSDFNPITYGVSLLRNIFLVSGVDFGNALFLPTAGVLLCLAVLVFVTVGATFAGVQAFREVE